MSSIDYSSPRYDALKELYYDPKHGLQSAARLKQKVPQYSVKEIEQWIKNQTTGQRFFERKQPKPYFPMSIGGLEAKPFLTCQCDLLDLTNLNPRVNSGYGYVWLMVDVFTRYVIATPMKGKADAECAHSLTRAVLSIEQKGFKMETLVSDNEPSFTGRLYRSECKDNDVMQVFVPVNDPSRHKSLAFIDSMCRTLRRLLERYMEANDTNRWQPAFKDLIDNYNSTVHTRTHQTPDAMLTEPVEPNRIYQEVRRNRRIAKASGQVWAKADIVVGSKVRYLIPVSTFAKRTKARWSSGVFTVSRVVDNCFYYLSIGPEGEEETPGIDNNAKFRKYELQLVSSPPQSRPVNMELKYDDDGAEPGSVEAQEDRIDYEAEMSRRRRLGREGIAPHQYSGDPDNSLEARYADEVRNLPARRERR
jgi:hypothetical protein